MNPIVLAFDPGPTVTAFAVVTWARSLRGALVLGGMIDSTHKDIETCLDWLQNRALLQVAPAAVAVEIVEGYVHEHARGAQLIATSRVAERICTLARARGLQVIELSASTWRRSLGVGASPKDAVVARALDLFVQDMPKKPATDMRTTKDVKGKHTHVRDATGLGIVALRSVPRRLTA